MAGQLSAGLAGFLAYRTLEPLLSLRREEASLARGGGREKEEGGGNLEGTPRVRGEMRSTGKERRETKDKGKAWPALYPRIKEDYGSEVGSR
jgi:hypothetical protein